MFLLVLLCVGLIPTSIAKLQMREVSGSISDTSVCSQTDSLTFDDCKKKCSLKDGCMIAFMNDDDEKCYLCPYGNISKIVKDDDGTSNVAVKVDSDDDDDSSGSCEEFENGSTLFGYVRSHDGEKLKYKLRYSNGSWKISYGAGDNDNSGNDGNSNSGLLAGFNTEGADRGCRKGWKKFARSRGPWCILPVYRADMMMYNWFEAQQQCQVFGAVLTGIENMAEHSYINNTIGAQWSTTLGGVWIGGRRNPACVKPKWVASLRGNTQTVFQWTDGFTTGNVGFTFLGGQPDGLIDPTTREPQSCTMMWMTHRAYPWRGYFDDQTCHWSYDPKANIRSLGYACGQQPLF